MSGLEPLLVISAISGLVGTGLSVGGQLSAASSQADANEQNLKLKRLQADELLSRQTVNEQILIDRADLIKAEFQTAFSGTGRRGGGLGGQLEISKNLQTTLINSRREAEFKADMLRKGADIEQELSSSLLAASKFTAAGSILTTGAKAFSVFSPKGESKGLFK